MIRKFIILLERDGEEIWRHYCKIRRAKNQKEFFDALKGIAKIVDNTIKRFSIIS
jgi:hypothetical protein